MRPFRQPHLVLTGAAVALIMSAAACSDSASDEPERNETTVVTNVETTTLLVREGPRRQTTGSVPHIQLDPATDPAVDAELRRRAFLLPGVEERPSGLSLPGAVALWLSSDLDLARQDVLASGREFAHFHPDGSLHIWLPVDRAEEVDATKWGELHPWVDRDGFWDGVVMVYVPETMDEADVALQIIVDAYNFITGANVDSTALG